VVEADLLVTTTIQLAEWYYACTISW